MWISEVVEVFYKGPDGRPGTELLFRDREPTLYGEVTDYVREEFNRADALQNEGRKGTVGFALTILKRSFP